MFPGFAKHGKKMTRMHISQMHQSGTGVAFAPTSCGVAFAPTQGGGRGECDPGVGANVTPAFVWQAQ